MRTQEIAKLSGLSAASFIAALIAGFLLDSVFSKLNLTLAVPSITIIVNFLLALLFYFWAIALFGILSALESQRYFLLGLSFGLPVTIFIALGVNLYTAIGAGLLFLGLIQYGLKVRQERQERLKVGINKFIRRGLGACISTLLLAISLSFYGAIATQGSEQLDPVVVTSRMAANGLNQYLTMKLKGYDPDMTVDEFVFLIVTQDIQPAKEVSAQTVPGLPAADKGDTFFGIDINELTKDLQNIPIDEIKQKLPADYLERIQQDPAYVQQIFQTFQSDVIGQQIAISRDNLLKTLHVQAEGTDPIGTVLEKVIAVQLNDLFRPFKYLLPPILALTLYFALQIFGFIYSWIVHLFAMVAYYILKWLNFFQIKREKKDAEVISLS